MDPYAQYQQQQQPQQASYGEPSQSYDQAYYASYNQSQIQQTPYDNYAQYYSNPNYQFQYSSEPNPIHPPGIPIPPDPTHVVDPEQAPLHHNSYYPQTEVAPYAGNVDFSQQYYGGHVAVPQKFLVTKVLLGLKMWQVAQTSYSGAGNTKGSGTVRGAGRGHFGPRSHGLGPFRGNRVRGRGRSRNAARNTVSTEGVSGSQLPTVPAPVRAPARMAWCEICRVDCNTNEILEQHKNGKKHKKSLKFQEELQKLNKIPVTGPEASNETGKVESSGRKVLLSNQSATNENKPVGQKDSGNAEPTDELTEKPGMDNSGVRGQGLKRRMRGGRGGKWMRTHDGPRRPVEPPKSKAVPLICELCNATCESTIVFDSHLKGKKHLANVKRFQGQQEAALQVLYPALQALYPTLQAFCQLNGNSSSPFARQFPKQDIHGSQSFTEPVSYLFPQGQSSASGPSANATSDPILESNVQQTSMLDGSTSGLNNSQDEPLQFVTAADLPVQSTSVGKTE
ncbi:hypothetical protein OROGR_012221 [Orobanche gracilis]